MLWHYFYPRSVPNSCLTRVMGKVLGPTSMVGLMYHKPLLVHSRSRSSRHSLHQNTPLKPIRYITVLDCTLCAQWYARNPWMIRPHVQPKLSSIILFSGKFIKPSILYYLRNPWNLRLQVIRGHPYSTLSPITANIFRLFRQLHLSMYTVPTTRTLALWQYPGPWHIPPPWPDWILSRPWEVPIALYHLATALVASIQSWFDEAFAALIW